MSLLRKDQFQNLLAQILVPLSNVSSPTINVSTSVASMGSMTNGGTSGGNTTRLANTSTTNSTNVTLSSVCGATCGQEVSAEVSIKVFTKKNKRDYKNYILHSICVRSINTLKQLKEVILEHLGKRIISFDLLFDVGYIRGPGSQKISFSESDDIKKELTKVIERGYSLWCEGLDEIQVKKRPVDAISVDSEDSEDESLKVKKSKAKKVSALEQKREAIIEIATDLKRRHGDHYNMVQYKFWAETLYNKRHSSKDKPPPGFIWGETKKALGEKSSHLTESVIKSVADIATALKSSSNQVCSSPSQGKDTAINTGISPGRKIDLQEKLLRQIELLHKMLESGAITPQQFEARRESVMKQLEQFD